MRALDGLVRVVVQGGDGGDFAIGFKLGPGAIPTKPTTTLSVSHDDAEAMQQGRLDPLAAFMAGRIRVEGDMTLVMQMQANMWAIRKIKKPEYR
jgi:putative sterol carrier protein